MMKLRKRQKNRHGAAVIEFAICLPVMLVLVLGAIESCSMIFVNQSLNVVAYEAIRATVKGNAQPGDGQARAQEVIAERRLKQAVVTFNPANPELANPSTPITVTVTAPTALNSVMRMDFFSGSLQAVAVMNKE